MKKMEDVVFTRGFHCISVSRLQGREQFQGMSPVAALGVGFERLATFDQVDADHAGCGHRLHPRSMAKGQI